VSAHRSRHKRPLSACQVLTPAWQALRPRPPTAATAACCSGNPVTKDGNGHTEPTGGEPRHTTGPARTPRYGPARCGWGSAAVLMLTFLGMVGAVAGMAISYLKG
jgi:hypothetical protein